MLHITDIDTFRSRVAHKDEIREANIGHNTISFCYMIAADGTFDDVWSRECRGITFDVAIGSVNGRPLHKFFNVGEREETRVENLDWSKVVRVMDKRDGSMIHTVATPAGVRLKSKKTFESDVAVAAQKWMEARSNFMEMVDRLALMGMTAIFEWTAPDARIVLFYPEPELKLLHIRNNITGAYWMSNHLHSFADQFGVKCVDEVDEFFWVMNGTRELDVQKMIEAAKTREGVEGWVIQFEDGNMVKLKTDWYMKRHDAMTFVRERDIAEAVLNESLDDLKSLLVSEGVNIDEILKIEELVLQFMRTIAHSVNTIVDAHKDLSRKDFALKFGGGAGEQRHEMFGLLMAKFIGKEPDIKSFFKKNVLREQFTLRQLVLIPSVAEGD